MNFLQQLALVLIGVLLTLAAQWVWHKYNQKEQNKSLTPTLSVSKIEMDGTPYAEIINSGVEDIKNLEVRAIWKKNGKEETRKLYRFFTVSQNPITQPSRNIQYLSVGEKIRATNLPFPSDDNRMRFLVIGKGVTSGKLLHHEDEIEGTAPPGAYLS